jgi:phage-related protein
MRELSTVAKIEKNKISSIIPLVYLVQIDLQPPDIVVRFTNNNENVVHNGQTFYATAMKVGRGNINSDGTMTSLSIDVGNVWSVFGDYIDQLDGGVDKPVTIYVVFLTPSGTIEVFRDVYKILATTVTPQLVHLELAMPNLLTQRAQRLTYVAGLCNFEYGSFECNVSDEIKNIYETCGKTLTDCIVRHQNADTLPFGGFPGLHDTYYIVR